MRTIQPRNRGKRRIHTVITALFFLLEGFVCFRVAEAETGMCLVVDQGKSGYDLPGKIYRIDFKDGKVINTTGTLASDAYCPRFSPDGNYFAYTKNANTVYICNLNGVVQKQFACDGNWLSWTNGGIWIHKNASDQFIRYDPATGAKLQQINLNGLKIGQAYVSQNDKTIGIRPDNARCVHLDDNNRVVTFGGGCSVGPSPDGQLLTWNLSGHLTMRIVDRNGNEIRFFRIEEILTGYTNTEYSWNRQLWSGNSNDVFIIPAGKMGAGTYQQYGSTVPWIYNLKTNKAYCLHVDKYANVFWFPYDYYVGKVPNLDPPVATSIAITPSTATVSPGQTVRFTATVNDQYGKPLASQPSTFSWSVSGGGSIAGGGVFTAGQALGGPFTITAKALGLEGTAQISVVNVILRVNCGTNGAGFDAAGWERDDAYLVPTKRGADYNWAQPIDLSGVLNAAPPEVYKSVVHYDHSYNFSTIQPGTYTLRFHFADLNATSDRRMRYVAEGVTILSNFNIVREAGVGKALVKDIVVSVNDNNGLQLECYKDAGNDVFECGIEILKTGHEAAVSILELLEPRGGETYREGDTLVITWRGVKDSLSAIDIFFSNDEGMTWHPINQKSIATTASNWGLYQWKIETFFGGSGQEVAVVTPTAMIKIEDYDKPFRDESLPFAIVAADTAGSSNRRLRPQQRRVGGFGGKDSDAVGATVWYDVQGKKRITSAIKTVRLGCWCRRGRQLCLKISEGLYVYDLDFKR